LKDNFFQRLHENKEALSKKQNLVAEYIIENYNDAVFLSCNELGIKAKVSDATVVRFAYALGYSGYTDMMKGLQNGLKGNLTSSGRIDILRKNKKRISNSIDFNRIQTILYSIIEGDYFNALLDDLLKCSKLILIGTESTTSIVKYLNYHLIRYGVNSEVITSNSEHIYKTYRQIDDETVVLSIAVRRYTRFQYNITSEFIRRGVKTYSITDDIKSPYNAIENTCIVLNTATEEGFNHLSHIVQLLLLQELIRGVILNKEISIKSEFESLEEYNSNMEIFINKRF